MAYGRPFAYDPTGSTVPTGTQKFGDLLIGEDLTLDYFNDYAGYKWYNGPDESIYWVIARYYSGASQNFDFWGAVKTNDDIEPILTGMTYYLSNFTELINNPRGCKTWLNDNNYWTSYGESTSPLILNLDATSYSSLTAPKLSATEWLDISGHINDATFSGATEYTSNPEKMRLTGFNFFVVNNNTDLLSPTNYTKIIWVNYSTLGNNTDILSGRYVDGGSSNFHRLWAGDSSYGSYKFRAGHTGSGDTVESTTTVSVDAWYCVAVTFDTINGWNLYVNGSSEDTNSDTNTFSYTGTGAGSGAIQVGAFNQSNKMSGYISQVRVYNSALTQTQIQEFYNQTRNIYEATPILTDGLKLQLDASISSSFTTGTTKWYDISGIGNNGDFNNTITYSGDADGSFVFDSDSGYIEIPTSSSLNLGPSNTFATIQMWVKISNFSSDIPYILQKYETNVGGYLIGATTRKILANDELNFKNQIYMGNFGKLNEGDIAPTGNYVGTYDSGYTAQTYPSYSNNDWVFVTFQVADSVSPGPFMVGLAFTGSSQYKLTSFEVGNRNNDKPLVIGNNYPEGLGSFSAFSGSIGAVYLYQKLLTNNEILQNYNATNDRFSKPDITPSPTPSPTITPTQTLTPSITPTPSSTETSGPTPTPSITPTNTPTPSSSPEPVTGYSFNLVALPYNLPEAGNSIMNNPGDNTSGSTEINLLSTTGRGFYFNSIDSSSVDRTNYYSGFTGQSITITFSQTGNTAIYSGDTDSLKYWDTPLGTGFVFGTGIGVPPNNIPSGTAVLIQSATTQFTIGLPVFVSLVEN